MPQQGAIPPPLPPSVEKAYRDKCIDLSRRMAEVSANNDEYRLRKIRIKRGILKIRLERAFLLEQLEKRTSQHVEDSEGSESGVETPQDKPLRIKRGHRRPSVLEKIRGDALLSTIEDGKSGIGSGAGEEGVSVRGDEESRLDGDEEEEIERMHEGEEDGDVEMAEGEGDDEGENGISPGEGNAEAEDEA